MIKEYWSSLQEREKRLLMVGGGLLLFFLGYWLFYSPLQEAQQRARAHNHELHEVLAWMQSVRKSAGSKSLAQSISSTRLPGVLNEQIRNSSLQPFPYALQQNKAGDIQISFDHVPWNAFLQWIWNTNEKYALNLQQLQADRLESSGMVKAYLVLRAAES